MKKKLLYLTRNLPPLVGGMENLNLNLVKGVSDYFAVRVIGPEGAGDRLPAGVKFNSIALKPLFWFLSVALGKGLYVSKLWSPDIVLGGSGLMAPMVFLAAKVSGAKSVLYVHGLDLAIKHPFYSCTWVRVIRQMDHVIANSSPTAKLAVNIGVDSKKITIVRPGVSLQKEKQSIQQLQDFSDKYALNNRPFILSVGRLTARKGLKEFVEYALPQIVKMVPNVLLLVVGGKPTNALHGLSQDPLKILAIAKKLNIDNNIKFIGYISEQELISAYQLAKVHVFPLLDIPGDPEGFGMVAIEAAMQGLPTVAFACGGVVDAVSEGVSGCLVEPENYNLFSEKVAELLTGQLNFCTSSKEFAKKFAWPEFHRKIKETLKSVIES